MEDIIKSRTRSTRNTKNWIKYLEIPIYGGELRIAVGNTMEEANKLAKIRDQKANAYDACCYRDENGNFALVFQRNGLTHSTIAHECAHATFRIAEHGAWGHNEGTLEPFSYLCGWVTGEVYNLFRKKKEKIK